MYAMSRQKISVLEKHRDFKHGVRGKFDQYTRIVIEDSAFCNIPHLGNAQTAIRYENLIRK